MKGLISAIRTLTVIPVPGVEGDRLSSALPWFPVVGLMLGLMFTGFAYAWGQIPFTTWPGACALILVCGNVWLTRGLHLDGLADWADSLGGFGREKRLAIMKDVPLGAFGVLAVVLAVLARWIFFSRLMDAQAVYWLIPVPVISRCMLVELQMILPYARAEGGMAAPFVEGASNGHRLMAHVLTVLICLCHGPAGLILYGAAWVFTRIYAARLKKTFNGFTGDLLGTASEMLEMLLLFLVALPGRHMIDYSGWNWIF